MCSGPRRALLAAAGGVALQLGAVLLAVVPVTAPAQGARREAPRAPADPLSREVSVAVRNVPIAEAIEVVARAASLRIAFSSDELPRGRAVTLVAARLTVREALERILDDTRLEARLGALDQVVLIPRASGPGRLASLVRRFVQSDATARTLSSIVVMGNPFGVPSISVPSSISVLDARVLQQPGVPRLDQALRANAPGLVIWNEGPAALVTRFASIRGVSSFAGNYLKTYIDGVEAAFPLALAPADPRTLDRVELIRGPQGAALYGADANSGVLQLVTAKGAPREGLMPQLLADVSIGQVASAFGPAVPEGRLSAVASGGGRRVTYAAGASGSGNGAYTPGGDARGWTAHVGTRAVRGPFVVEATARAGGFRSGVPVSPAFQRRATRPFPEVPSTQSVAQQTGAVTVRWTPAPWWEHQLTTGVDVVQVDALREPATLYSFPDQSVRRLRGQFARASARYTTRLSSERRRGVKASATVIADPSVLRARVAAAPRPAVQNPNPPLVPVDQRTGGLVTQLDLDVRRTLFATLGVRSERVLLREGRTEVVGLPSFGMVAVQPVGGWTIRPRVAFGRGLRAPPNAVILGGVAPPEPGAGGPDPRARLRAETQRGVEAGLDLLRANRVTMRATYFDQLASDLVAPVLVRDPPRPDVTPQNLGEITNRGWELELSARAGAFTVDAWATLQDSRVRRLADDYEGELQTGDLPLEVPRHAVGGSVRWQSGRLAATASLSSVGPWINYDGELLLDALRTTPPGRPLPSLRAFWRRYPSVTTGDVMVSWAFGQGAAYLAAANLANIQTAYRSNAIVTSGRALRAGLDLRL